MYCGYGYGYPTFGFSGTTWAIIIVVTVLYLIFRGDGFHRRNCG